MNIDLEQMFYDARPYFYALFGVFALMHNDNRISLVCGLTLLFCSGFVFNRRISYRGEMAQINGSMREHRNN